MNYDSFCRHFLTVFDEVTVVGRLFDIEDETAKAVTGPNVTFQAIPQYSGPLEFILHSLQIIKILFKLSEEDAAFVLRVPGTIPSIFSIIAGLRSKKFAIQCVADPADQLGKGSVNHPLRKIFRFGFMKILKWQCNRAGVTMYVTKKSLQRRYPPQKGKPTYSYTDLVLQDNCYRDSPKSLEEFNTEEPSVINVGMMVQMYKGQDVLIKALHQCINNGLNVKLKLIGDGEYREYFESLAKELNVERNIKFYGKVRGGKSIRDLIDESDMFVLPSRQEGLPRALMEAMARGIPCVGSNVGGIPELLPSEYIFESEDYLTLANIIRESFTSISKLQEMGQMSLEKARDYHFRNMIRIRTEYYRAVLRLY
ncbi:MAG: glycosyltransferase family 4 protein [Candidatus Thiodiazotropha sp.]